MKTRVTIIFAILVFLSGCVSFEIKDAISDTIDASKELYQTIKRKSNGEEERHYTHTLTSTIDNNNLEQISECKVQIKEIIANSAVKIQKVLSESSDISTSNGIKSITCSMLVLVAE